MLRSRGPASEGRHDRHAVQFGAGRDGQSHSCEREQAQQPHQSWLRQLEIRHHPIAEPSRPDFGHRGRNVTVRHDRRYAVIRPVRYSAINRSPAVVSTLTASVARRTENTAIPPNRWSPPLNGTMSVRPANPTPACATYVINAVIVPTRTPREAAERWARSAVAASRNPTDTAEAWWTTATSEPASAAAVAPSATSRYVPTTDHVSSVVRRGRFIPLVRVRTLRCFRRTYSEVPSCPVRVRHTIMAIDHAQADLCGCVRPTACVDRNGGCISSRSGGSVPTATVEFGPAR